MITINDAPRFLVNVERPGRQRGNRSSKHPCLESLCTQVNVRSGRLDALHSPTSDTYCTSSKKLLQSPNNSLRAHPQLARDAFRMPIIGTFHDSQEAVIMAVCAGPLSGITSDITSLRLTDQGGL